MGNQLTRMFIPVSNSSPRQRQSRTEKIGERIFPFAPGGGSKGMTSSPSENKCPTAAAVKEPTFSEVKPECQCEKGQQELHPDRSHKTTNEQTLKQNEEELRKKEQEIQEKEKEMEKLKREKENAQHESQQQAQENKTPTARIEELEEEIERLKAEIKKLEKQKEMLKKLKEENEEERRKKEQEIQEKVKEIEELKRKEKNAQNKLQQQAQENKILIEVLKEEIKRLNAKIKKLEEEVENLKEENEEIKGNQHYLFLAAMCDQLQKNFYQIVFYPYDFSKEKQSYKVVNIERDIKYGFYGLTTEEKKRQARERWSDLMEKLGWKTELHLSGIVQIKQDRIPTAHPEITKDMKESLEDGANALKLDEPTFVIVQNLIDMWFKTEDLVQEQK